METKTRGGENRQVRTGTKKQEAVRTGRFERGMKEYGGENRQVRTGTKKQEAVSGLPRTGIKETSGGEWLATNGD